MASAQQPRDGKGQLTHLHAIQAKYCQAENRRFRPNPLRSRAIFLRVVCSLFRTKANNREMVFIEISEESFRPSQRCHSDQSQHCHFDQSQHCHSDRSQHCHFDQSQHCHSDRPTGAEEPAAAFHHLQDSNIAHEIPQSGRNDPSPLPPQKKEFAIFHIRLADFSQLVFDSSSPGCRLRLHFGWVADHFAVAGRDARPRNRKPRKIANLAGNGGHHDAQRAVPAHHRIDESHAENSRDQ